MVQFKCLFLIWNMWKKISKRWNSEQINIINTIENTLKRIIFLVFYLHSTLLVSEPQVLESSYLTNVHPALEPLHRTTLQFPRPTVVTWRYHRVRAKVSHTPESHGGYGAGSLPGPSLCEPCRVSCHTVPSSSQRMRQPVALQLAFPWGGRMHSISHRFQLSASLVFFRCAGSHGTYSLTKDFTSIVV